MVVHKFMHVQLFSIHINHIQCYNRIYGSWATAELTELQYTFPFPSPYECYSSTYYYYYLVRLYHSSKSKLAQSVHSSKFSRFALCVCVVYCNIRRDGSIGVWRCVNSTHDALMCVLQFYSRRSYRLWRRCFVCLPWINVNVLWFAVVAWDGLLKLVRTVEDTFETMFDCGSLLHRIQS